MALDSGWHAIPDPAQTSHLLENVSWETQMMEASQRAEAPIPTSMLISEKFQMKMKGFLKKERKVKNKLSKVSL